MDKATVKLEEDKKRTEKMEIKLYIADIINYHNTKTDATWLKMKKIKIYVIEIFFASNMHLKRQLSLSRL